MVQQLLIFRASAKTSLAAAAAVVYNSCKYSVTACRRAAVVVTEAAINQRLVNLDVGR